MKREPMDEHKKRLVGFIIRCVFTVAVAAALWLLLRIPGEKEHQIYLTLAMIVFAGGLTAVNISWYKD